MRATGAILTIAPAQLLAANIGIYCWKLEPYVDVVCVDVVDNGFVFVMHGA